MRRALIVALAGLISLPMPAQALSCMRPDVRRAYQQAAKSPDIFIIVLGSLDFDPAQLPGASGGARKSGRKLTARLQGRGVTPKGFSAWIDREITLDIKCVSEWCGSVTKGEQMLMFLRQGRTGETLDVGPCGGFAFPQPDGRSLKQLRQCLSGGPCQPNRR